MERERDVFSEEKKASTPRRTARILVLDDEPHLRNIMTTVMNQEGYKVFSTDDGNEAFELVLSHGFIDIVLLNLQMPEMNGEDFLKRLQELPARKRPTPIMVTGHLLAESYKKHLKSLGAVDLLPKPFKIEDLKKAVNAAMEAREE
ncbi:MAG: response regulator [Planctomycetes bacterium]|nr:response regulator [Planctomycetota bacterium]